MDKDVQPLQGSTTAALRRGAVSSPPFPTPRAPFPPFLRGRCHCCHRFCTSDHRCSFRHDGPQLLGASCSVSVPLLVTVLAFCCLSQAAALQHVAGAVTRPTNLRRPGEERRVGIKTGDFQTPILSFSYSLTCSPMKPLGSSSARWEQEEHPSLWVLVKTVCKRLARCLGCGKCQHALPCLITVLAVTVLLLLLLVF